MKETHKKNDNSKRQLRLSEAYMRELSDIICFHVRDPRLSGVYVTQVLFSPDLKRAKVYFNISGGRVREKEVLEGFSNSKGFLKREVGVRVNIKNTPDLIFYYDDREEIKQTIDQLFDQIGHQKNETGEENQS